MIVTTFFKVLWQIKGKNIKVFICSGSKYIFFTIGNLPLFLRENEYLFFLLLRFDIGREQLVVTSCLMCLMLKLAFLIFEGLFFWPLILYWNRENLKLKNIILFKHNEKPIWSTVSYLLTCQQKLSNTLLWNILVWIEAEIKCKSLDFRCEITVQFLREKRKWRPNWQCSWLEKAELEAELSQVCMYI